MPRASGYIRNGWAWAKLRDWILKRDNFRCYAPYPTICVGVAVTADHLVPVAEGGSDDPSNLKAICEPCHERKTKAEAKRGIARHQGIASRTRPSEPHPGLNTT